MSMFDLIEYSDLRSRMHWLMGATNQDLTRAINNIAKARGQTAYWVEQFKDRPDTADAHESYSRRLERETATLDLYVAEGELRLKLMRDPELSDLGIAVEAAH